MTSKVVYHSGLRTVATHLKSEQEIITDAPVDNEGKGEAFSPTDLMSTSLASCMLTIMGIAARNHDINMDGATATVNKIMSAAPRKVEKVEIVLTMPAYEYSSKDKKILEKAAEACPVGRSLHPDLIQNIKLVWS